MDKWKEMTAEDKKFFVGCMLLGVLVLSGVSWFSFFYRTSHYAHVDTGMNRGIVTLKYTYVENGNTYGLMTLLLEYPYAEATWFQGDGNMGQPTLIPSNKTGNDNVSVTWLLANGTIPICWTTDQTEPCQISISITMRLDFHSMDTLSVAAFAQTKVGDTVTVTRTYLCDGFAPNSIVSYWIRGCELQNTIVTVVEESK